MKFSSMTPSKSTTAGQNTSDTVPVAFQTSERKQPHSDDPEKQAESHTETTEKESAFKSLGLLDRFLALWIFLAMLIGILLGNFVPNTGPALQKGKFVGVSFPIGVFRAFTSPLPSQRPADSQKAIGLLVMMYPILCKVKYETLHLAFRQREIWVQILFSIFVNWIIAPFLMVTSSLSAEVKCI